MMRTREADLIRKQLLHPNVTRFIDLFVLLPMFMRGSSQLTLSGCATKRTTSS
jgi:hypothetical protein